MLLARTVVLESFQVSVLHSLYQKKTSSGLEAGRLVSW
jgi:hypothetical protein